MYFELSSSAALTGSAGAGAAAIGAVLAGKIVCTGKLFEKELFSVVVSVVVFIVILKSSISNFTSVAPDLATNLIKFWISLMSINSNVCILILVYIVEL